MIAKSRSRTISRGGLSVDPGRPAKRRSCRGCTLGRPGSALPLHRHTWITSPALSILWLALLGANNAAIGQCVVAPTLLDFGNICFESVYLDKDFTITNSGEEQLSVDVTSTPASGFVVVVGGGPYTLDPDEVRTVTVRFQPSPQNPGVPYSDTIETGNALCSDVDSDGVGGPNCHILAQGSILVPELDFGERQVGTSLLMYISITNGCDESLSGNVSESCQHYGIDSGEGPFTLEYDESELVWVRFQPESEGTHNCQIETGNSRCADVPATGIGVPAPEIPTASNGALIAMTLMLLTAGFILIRQRHRAGH